MSQLVLTDEQARILKESVNKVKMVDSNGEVIGFATRPIFTPEKLERIRRLRASGERGHTVDEKNRRIEQLVKELESQGK